MKTAITIAVVAVLALAVWLLFLTGPSFGVGSDAPIGSADEIVEYLKEKELILDPAGVGKDTLARFFGEEFAAREDLVPSLWLDRVPGYRHFVLVVQDGSGRVVGVGGQFQSGMREFSTTGSRTQVFFARLWLAVCGDEPAFDEERFGSRDRDVDLVGRWSGGGANAQWRKSVGGGLAMAHQTADFVAFVSR
jgi:hypothetical protein